MIPINDDSIRESGSSEETDLDLKAILDVLTRQLQRGRVDTKLAALRWIYHLYKISRDKVSSFGIFFQTDSALIWL